MLIHYEDHIIWYRSLSVKSLGCLLPWQALVCALNLKINSLGHGYAMREKWELIIHVDENYSILLEFLKNYDCVM